MGRRGRRRRRPDVDRFRPIQPEQIADLIETVIRMPDFVDVARLEVFPTDQATGGGTMVKFPPE